MCELDLKSVIYVFILIVTIWLILFGLEGAIMYEFDVKNAVSIFIVAFTAHLIMWGMDRAFIEDKGEGIPFAIIYSCFVGIFGGTVILTALYFTWYIVQSIFKMG